MFGIKRKPKNPVVVKCFLAEIETGRTWPTVAHEYNGGERILINMNPHPSETGWRESVDGKVKDVYGNVQFEVWKPHHGPQV